MKVYGLIGAGGFARQIMPLVQNQLENSCSNYVCFFVVEDEYKTEQSELNGIQVITLSEFINYECKEKFFNIAISDSITRERIEKSIDRNIAQPFTICSKDHVSLMDNKIGEGAMFCTFTLVTSNVNIGKFFHCNSYSSVSHDCVIGDYVTFAPGVKCNGYVVIEDHAYIGAGVIIKDGTKNPVRIGKHAVIGMGAVVTKSVPAGTTVIGNPARPILKF